MYIYIYIYIYIHTHIYVYIYIYIYIYIYDITILYIYYKEFKEIQISTFEAIVFGIAFFNCIIYIKPVLQITTLYKL